MRQPLNPEAVNAFLTEHLGGIGELTELRGGEWSQAFAFRRGGRDLVARFGDHVDDFEKDRAAFAFSCAGLPVPEVLEIGIGPGFHFCISE